MDDWRYWAACLPEDPELFFPLGTTGAASDQIQQAKAVCRSCPVQQQCLQWALNHHQDAGVWGGLSEDERRNIRRLYGSQWRGFHVIEDSEAPHAPHSTQR